MDIQLNGDPWHTDTENLSVSSLLEQLHIQPAAIALLRNDQVVPKTTYSSTILSDGDCLELITYAGGG